MSVSDYRLTEEGQALVNQINEDTAAGMSLDDICEKHGKTQLEVTLLLAVSELTK